MPQFNTGDRVGFLGKTGTVIGHGQVDQEPTISPSDAVNYTESELCIVSMDEPARIEGLNKCSVLLFRAHLLDRV